MNEDKVNELSKKIATAYLKTKDWLNDKAFLHPALVLVAICHFIIILGNILACIIIPFTTPWYIALPLCTFLVRLGLMPDDCPVTRLENKIRVKLGMVQIDRFITHYYIKPIKWIFNEND